MSADREWSQTKGPREVRHLFCGRRSHLPAGDADHHRHRGDPKDFPEMTKSPGFALSWTPTKADVAASGDMGNTAGTYEMTMGGVTEKGRYVTSWKKQADGTWKVTDDIFNADAAPPPPAGAHVTMGASDLKWGGFASRTTRRRTRGRRLWRSEPGQPYVLRAQLPANYKISPHWHPTTENITVLSGTVALGWATRSMNRRWKVFRQEDLRMHPPTCTTFSWRKQQQPFRCTGWDRLGLCT